MPGRGSTAVVMLLVIAVMALSFMGCARRQPAPTPEPLAEAPEMPEDPKPEGVPPLEVVEELADQPPRTSRPFRDPDLGDPTVPAIRWLDDLERAKSRAESESKPLMVNFHADWAGPAKEMDRRVWVDLPVRKLAREFVTVRIDCVEDEQTPKKYNVVFVPSVLFLRPDGSEFGRINHMLSPDEMVEELESVLEKFKRGR